MLSSSAVRFLGMITPALAAWASPWMQAAAAATTSTVRRVGGAFEELLRSGDEPHAAAGEAEASAWTGPAPAPGEVLRTQLQDAALARLREAGVVLDAPLVLEDDGLGGIRVADGHPAAAWIERLLSDDPQVANLWRALAAQHRDSPPPRDATVQPLPAGRGAGFDRGWFDAFSPLDREPLRVTVAPRG